MRDRAKGASLMAGKILVVEDNKTGRVLLRDVLTHAGYEVIEAVNGAEGVKAAREQMPDLVLMDMQMPVMDGLNALKALRDDPATKGMKVVAVTSFAMKGDRERILGEGFDGYMAKPVDTRALPRLVKKLMETA